ncbi:phosphoribosyltransferase family protein [Microbacterium sp.]|uniref:phosphoribosyltransferase family protein n=1 Tax=Microbacterium sp. TaxID=51671 RepID=UPI003C72E5E6
MTTSPTSTPSAPATVSDREFRLALYDVAARDGGFHATSEWTPQPFAADEYSRFKYGDEAQAARYGATLARALSEHFAARRGTGGDNYGEGITIVGTPYKSLPNAAKLLADAAERELRVRQPDARVSGTRIYQHRLAAGDYGRLPQAEREARNRQKRYFLDAADFAGRHVVLIDDVRVTGSIERSVLTLLDGVPWASLTVASLLRIDPETARQNPQVEDALNHARIAALSDLLPLMSADRFVLITRTVKRILEADLPALQAFLAALGPARRAELYRAAVDDGYSVMEGYAASFGLLESFYPY